MHNANNRMRAVLVSKVKHIEKAPAKRNKHANNLDTPNGTRTKNRRQGKKHACFNSFFFPLPPCVAAATNTAASKRKSKFVRGPCMAEAARRGEMMLVRRAGDRCSLLECSRFDVVTRPKRFKL